MGLIEPLQVRQGDQPWYPIQDRSFVAHGRSRMPCAPAVSRSFTSFQMVHTHTRSYGAGQLNEGWPWRWRDDQPTPTKGPPGRSQRQQKKDINNNKDGGGGKKQGEGEKTATSGTTSTTGSALVGTELGMRFAFDEQHHTTHKHKRTKGTQQGREGNKHTPDPSNNQGQPWKGRKKQKANTPEGRQQKRRRWGGGRTTPWKLEKDTKDLTQPNLPGDATDQPNPNTKTHYREGPKGDKQNTNQKESCSKRVHYPKNPD